MVVVGAKALRPYIWLGAYAGCATSLTATARSLEASD